MKLLDFTGRKVDPSLMMGFKDNKKEQDPNIKVRLFYRLEFQVANAPEILGPVGSFEFLIVFSSSLLHKLHFPSKKCYGRN